MATRKYKATYRNPKQNPFGSTMIPTKTVEIDESVPFKNVEKMAREGAEGLIFVKLEVID